MAFHALGKVRDFRVSRRAPVLLPPLLALWSGRWRHPQDTPLTCPAQTLVPAQCVPSSSLPFERCWWSSSASSCPTRESLIPPPHPRVIICLPETICFGGESGFGALTPGRHRQGSCSCLEEPVTIVRPVRGNWVARSVEPPTLDFDSGRDLGVVASSSASGSVLSGESAWVSLCPSPSPDVPPPAHAPSLLLSPSQINKSQTKKQRHTLEIIDNTLNE